MEALSRYRRSLGERGESLLLATILLCHSLGAFGCASLPSESERVTPGFRVVSIPSDTIDAAAAAPFVVEVGDSNGMRVRDREVLFESLGQGLLPRIQFSDSPGGPSNTRWFVRTDREGRAQVYVLNGAIAGSAPVRVALSTLGLMDTLVVPVLPGAPVGIVALPRDTAVLAGGSFLMRGGLVDRNGNPRADPVTLRVDSPLTSSERIIGGAVYARARFVVESGSLADTGWVSVVPPGRLAGVDFSRGIVLSNTDGSASRILLAAPQELGGWLAWAPDGRELAFDGQHPNKLRVTDTLGHEHLAISPNSGFSDEYAPQYSPDGLYLYLTADDRTARVRRDGSGFELISGMGLHPTVSSDGLLVDGSMRIRYLYSGTTVQLPFSGWSPRFAPDGSVIAYLHHTTRALWMMASDGTGSRAVTSSGRYAWSIDWSPDQRWIAAYNADSDRIEIIDAATGLILPLPFGAGWRGVAWKP